MQKIGVEVLEHMLSAHLTNKETDLILYIARYQDDYGNIQGVYYKSICETLHMSYQGYYDCLRSLEKKGIITCEKRSYADWDISICGNSFAGKENYGRGYISLKHGMTYSREFQKLKGRAKLMALYLLREWLIYRKKTGNASYRIGRDTLQNKFKLMGVKWRTVRAYLGALSPFLTVYLEDGQMYYLTFKKSAFEKANGKNSENDELRKHLAMTACRRNRIKENLDQAVKSIADLLSQYHPFDRIKYGGYDITALIAESIRMKNIGIANKYRWKRTYDSFLVHKLLRNDLGLEEGRCADPAPAF